MTKKRDIKINGPSDSSEVSEDQGSQSVNTDKKPIKKKTTEKDIIIETPKSSDEISNDPSQ